MTLSSPLPQPQLKRWAPLLLSLITHEPAASLIVGSNNILLGCTIGVLSSACQSIGLILQRKSHLINSHAKNLGIVVPPYKRSLWHIGFLLFIIANIFGSSIQITTLPLIVLSPLQSIGLVFNVLFNALILNEDFNFFSLIGTFLISLGALLIAFFGGSINEPEYDLDEFITLLKQSNFITWVILDMIVVFLCLSWIVISNSHLHYHHHDQDHHQYRLRDSGSTSILASVKNWLTKILNLDLHMDILKHKIYLTEVELQQQERQGNGKHIFLDLKLKVYQISLKYISLFYHKFFAFSHERQSLIQGILFGVSSGTLSAHSLLLAKSTIEILLLMFVNKKLKQLNNINTYLLLISFFTLCLSQLYLLNQGLKHISTSILYPLVFCIYNITNISNGVIFYQQMQEIISLNGVFIVLGTVLVITGVFVLSLKHDSSSCSTNNHGHNRSSNSLSATTTPLLQNSNEFGVNDYNSCSPTTPRRQSKVWKPNVNEQVLTSMDSLTNPQDPTSPYYDPNIQLSPVTSNQPSYAHFSNPLMKSNSNVTSNSNNNNNTTNNTSYLNSPNELIKPFFKKTSDNISTAGRKVSNFLRKSVDTLSSHVSTDTPESPVVSNVNNSKILTPIISQETSDNDIGENGSEYVSFKNMKSPLQSSNNVFNDNSDRNMTTDTIATAQKGKSETNNDPGATQDSSISSAVPSFRTLNNLSSPIDGIANGVLSISPKTVGTRGGLNLIVNNKAHHHSSHLANNNHHQHNTGHLRSEEDYNSNNSYNYSLHNTIEEIENQMSAYNYQPYDQRNSSSKVFVPPLHLGSIIPSTSTSIKDKDFRRSSSNSFSDKVSSNTTLDNQGINSNNNISPIKRNKARIAMSINTQPPSTTQLYSSTSKYFKRNFTTSGVLKRDGFEFGKRVYSFEQNELLSELTK